MLLFLAVDDPTNSIPFTNPPEDFGQFMNWLIHLAPAPGLLIALIFLGKLIRKSKIDNRWIPLALAGAGMVVFPLLLWTVGSYKFKAMDFLYGFLIGCASVWSNQFFRQMAPLLLEIMADDNDKANDTDAGKNQPKQ